MINLLLKLLFPYYYEYQEELEKQIKNLEREMLNNER